MNHGDTLLAAVLANPEDDTPRLAYADWLAENGQPERAEFIIVQCELARCPVKILADRRWNDLRYMAPEPWDTFRRRERELLDNHGSYWALPIDTAVATTWGFRRGFVESVTSTFSGFKVYADALIWPPMVKCRWCAGTGVSNWTADKTPIDRCPECSGNKRVPNPNPLTSTHQPVRRVTLTTWPDIAVDGYDAEDWAMMNREIAAAVIEKELGRRWPGVEFDLTNLVAR